MHDLEVFRLYEGAPTSLESMKGPFGLNISFMWGVGIFSFREPDCIWSVLAAYAVTATGNYRGSLPSYARVGN